MQPYVDDRARHVGSMPPGIPTLHVEKTADRR
jgi:hypothetical protein